VKKAVFVLSAGLAPAAAFAAEGGVNVVPSNIGLQIWVIATFLVMFVLLAKLAFKPIIEALDKRGQTIKASLDEAEKTRAESKLVMEQYQKQLTEARNEAKKIIDEGKVLGESVRKEVVEKAQAEATAVIQRAREEIVREKEKSLQELKDTVASLSVQIAGKVIEKQVDEATHRVLINNLITDLTKIRKA